MTTPNLDELLARMTWDQKLRGTLGRGELDLLADGRRDPRPSLGRVVEGFGEDSYRAAALGAAKVRAYQGDDLAASGAIAACLYPVASIAQPVQRLRGFRRVPLAAGAAADVLFELGAAELGFWSDENGFVLEPGELIVTITDGPHSERLTLAVTAEGSQSAR